MTIRRLAGVLVAIVTAIVGTGCGGSDEARPDLAFVSTRDGDYAIFEMNSDGGAQHRLTPRESTGASSPARLFFQVEPAWSPDGSQIAFSSARSGSFDLFVMDADGTDTRRLTSGTQDDSQPTWSCDGKAIAFARASDIYVMAADGSSPRRISDVLVEESDPAWSPDCAWITYIRRTPGTAAREVWVMRQDGSERRGLTRQNGRAFGPAWSPDSARIVFTTNAEGEVYELFTIGLDGKGLSQVVPTASDNFEPSWSPDGATIAYMDDGAIFTVELGGGEVERLTDSATNDSSPVWNPQPPPGD